MIDEMHDPWRELRRGFFPLAGTAVVAVVLMVVLAQLYGW